MICVFVRYCANIVGSDEYQVIIEAMVPLFLKNIVLIMKKKYGCLCLKKRTKTREMLSSLCHKKDNSLKTFKYMSA